MNAPDAVRGPEGQGNPPPANAPAAVRTATAREGVTTVAAPYRPAAVEPPKSAAKWVVAAVVLAVMVFGITFALNFMGSSGKEDKVKPASDVGERRQLSFVTTRIPEEKPGDPTVTPLDAELRQPGWCDFWFENPNPKPVVVGLFSTSCTCTGAQVFLLPPGSKKEPGREAALEKTATATMLTLGSEEGVTVLPEQVGWVRLQWSGESKKALLSLKLWLNGKAVGPFPDLETLVRFHEPLKVQQPAFMPFKGASTTKLPWTQPLICWSSTRDDFAVKRAILGGTEGVAEPLSVGEPERLSKEECAALAQRVSPEGPVRSAYRIPVTLQDRTPAGALIDAGPFRRRVELSLADGPGEVVPVVVEGDIQGDLQVLGLTTGRIEFQSFARKKGSAPRTVRLQTLRPGLKLEVDRTRTAEFLDIDLKVDPSTAADAGTAWDMTVTVKKDAVSGRFPRDTPESFRDCAVYVRPAGDAKARATRIAVDGTATD